MTGANRARTKEERGTQRFDRCENSAQTKEECGTQRYGRCETAGVKTRNLIIAAVITGALILGAFIVQFATDPRFLGG